MLDDKVLEREEIKKEVNKTPKALVLSMQEYEGDKLSHDGSMTLMQVLHNGLPQLVKYDFSNAKDIKLREIQVDTKIEMTKYLRKSIRKIVLSLSTGAGKTILAASIMRSALEKNPDQTIFFCVNRNSLIVNAKESIEDVLGIRVGVIQGSTPMNLELPIQIVSLQTIENRLDETKGKAIRDILKQLNILMLFNDEAHYNYNGLHTVIEMIEEKGISPFVFGLTATAFPTHLAKTYQGFVKVSFLQEQINKGILTNYKMYSYSETEGINLSNLKKNSSGEFTDKSAGDEVEKLIVAGNPAQDWAGNSESFMKYTVVYCPTIASCEAMYDHWVDSGVIDQNQIGVMHSKSPDAMDVLAEFKAGGIRVVISVDMLREGVDVPHMSCLVIFTPLAENIYKNDEPNSITTFMQRHGRVIRTFEGGILVKDIATGKHQIVPIDSTIDVDRSKQMVIETLPKKDYAVILDYTGLDRFATPMEIDQRYDSLPKAQTKKEKTEDLKSLEDEILDKIEDGDIDDLKPSIICGECSSTIPAESLPVCPDCGFSVKKVVSKHQIGEVELEFVDGECVISHMPDSVISKIDKRKEEKEKKKKRKNVNYSALLPEQKEFLMSAVIMDTAEAGLADRPNVKSIHAAKYFSVAGSHQKETSGNAYAALKKRAIKHIDYVYEELGNGNTKPLDNLNKYRNQIRKKSKFKRRHTKNY